jgi:hypothetical protein
VNINIHIERLILEGLPVTAAQAPQVAAAIQTELSRLLAAHGLSPELERGAAVPEVHAAAIRFALANAPERLGQSVAHAVCAGLGGARAKEAR